MREPGDAMATATEMLRWLETRRISASELLALHRARIEQHNPELNVLVELDFERAQASAALADARRSSSGQSAALLGLPFTLKEAINARGLRTTVGMPMWAEFRSEHDAALTSHVQAAGGVLLGKTNVPPLLADWQASNAIYGRTNNPWDLTHTCGGSTGGAAAVAAGLTPLEFGSDIAGSIRVPAMFCGVYGHRPSDSAVPRSGQFPFPPLPNPAVFMAVQGPLARCAEDLELALGVIAGPEVGEDVAWRLQLPAARHARLSDFRIALMPELDWMPCDGEILASQAELAAKLGAHGCSVTALPAETLGDLREGYALYQSLLLAVTSTGSPPEVLREQAQMVRAVNDEWSAARLRALTGVPSDYIRWISRRERIRMRWRELFREFDVLLAPAFWTTAFPHRRRTWPPTAESIAATISVNGRAVREELGSFYPSLATLPGLPATAFPLGRNRAGLPLGLQAIGPYLEDLTPLRFAALVGREWGGFEAPPRYATSPARPA